MILMITIMLGKLRDGPARRSDSAGPERLLLCCSRRGFPQWGNPTALASIKAGETVLDLGSGAGFDCLLASNKVGSKGRVIGVDMT
jgi:hypothetical protein